MEIDDTFEISSEVVKKQARVFKSVLKVVVHLVDLMLLGNAFHCEGADLENALSPSFLIVLGMMVEERSLASDETEEQAVAISVMYTGT